MRKLGLSLLLFVVMLSALIGCPVFRTAMSPQEGPNGWHLGPAKPKTEINFVRNLDSVVVRPSEYSLDVLWLRITVQTDKSGFPVPPWCKFEREEKSLLRGVFFRDVYYRIPEGRKFDDIYDWYIDWFNGKVK